MNANPDDWWLRRRQPSVSPGDAWSGGGKAYRAWMGSEGEPRRAAHPGHQRRAGSASPNPRSSTGFVAPRRRARGLQTVAPRPGSTVGVLLSILTGVPLACFSSRKRLRVSLLLGAAGLAAVIFLAPLAWARRWDPCAAAEVALVDEAIGPGSQLRSEARGGSPTGPGRTASSCRTAAWDARSPRRSTQDGRPSPAAPRSSGACARRAHRSAASPPSCPAPCRPGAERRPGGGALLAGAYSPRRGRSRLPEPTAMTRDQHKQLEEAR